MVELEDTNQFRFYKLKPLWRQRCVPECNGLLHMHMKNSSINLICMHTDCFREFEVKKYCTYCGKEHLFEDLTCDNCEPIVINITSWKVSIEECEKAEKKLNRAYKNNMISEEEWKNAKKFNIDERERCQKELKKVDESILEILAQSTN